jgi:AraC family transcriptional regulator
VCKAGPKDPVFEEQHAWMSVSAVLSGSFTYRSNRGRVLMAPGSLLLGQQGNCFRCTHEHGAGDRCVAFYFDPEFIEELAAEIPSVSRTCFEIHRVPPLQALVPLFSDVRALADDGDATAEEELALRIAGAALRLASGGRDFNVNGLEERRMVKALSVIAQRLTEPLSIAGLAKEVGMSRYHFLRTFHRTIGETPYRYILSRRLVFVAERLSSTSESVLDAALACGFGDLSEFTRRFRARFGVTPGMYRQQRRRSHRIRHAPSTVRTLGCP